MKTWRTTSAMLLCALLASPNALKAQAVTNSVMGCSVITRHGHKLNVTRFVSISNGLAVYESRGSLHDLWIADIRKITCDKREYEIVNDTLRPVVPPMEQQRRPARDEPPVTGSPSQPVAPDSNDQVSSIILEPSAPPPSPLDTTPRSADLAASETAQEGPAPGSSADPPMLTALDLYELGKQDAKKYYRGGGAFALGALLSPTLFGPLIVAAVPASPYSKHNPNLGHYIENPHYMKGYRKKAQAKKAGSTMLGMLIGLTLLFGANL